jgi:small ligand-binding sensory domain FIST
MRWASAISTHPSALEAIDDCSQHIRRRLGQGVEPHLILLFVSPHYHDEWERRGTDLVRRFPQATIIGCSGAGVIGAGQEEESSPAISLTAGHLPHVKIASFHIPAHDMPSPDAPPDAWHAQVGVPPEVSPQFLLLIEPFSTPSDAVLEGLDFAFPASVKIGGLASGGLRPGSHALFLNDRIHFEGVVGVALSGNLIIDTVVAQGCRPVGHPMRITKAEGSQLLSVDDERPMVALQRLYEQLSPSDQSLVRRNLFLGIAMDPLQEHTELGDFLIRNLVGGDPDLGTLIVGAALSEGQIVQFHIRDAVTSREDLTRCLEGYVAQARGQPAEGAVLFSCTGRGQGLYGQPNHDSDLFQGLVGELPLGGFFSNGEIGPVGGSTYLHSYTSSFGVIRPRSPAD